MVTMASLSATSPLPGRRVWRSVPSFIDTDQTSCKGRQSSVPESCPPSLTPALHPVLPVLSVLRDFDSLDQMSVEDNTQLGFDVAEQGLGISPLMSVEEMSSAGGPDSLSMVMYLSQFYQLFKDTPPAAGQKPSS